MNSRIGILTLIFSVFCINSALFAQFDAKMKQGKEQTPNLEFQKFTRQLPTTKQVLAEDFGLKQTIDFDAAMQAQQGYRIRSVSNWDIPTWITFAADKTSSQRAGDDFTYHQTKFDEVFQSYGFQQGLKDFELLAVQKEGALKHSKYQQHIQNVPVFGATLIFHEKNNELTGVTGRCYPAGAIQGDALISPSDAKAIAEQRYVDSWRQDRPEGIAVPEQCVVNPIWWPMEETQSLYRAYELLVYPDYVHPRLLIIDASSGLIIKEIKQHCQMHAHMHDEAHKTGMEDDDGATATDLNGTQRNIRVTKVSNTYYMMNTETSMFNASQSSLPGSPVGAIVTLNANYNSPASGNFDYDFFTSSNNSWTDRASVSAHYNAETCFQYFKSTFNRNSLDNAGSNIISFVHVTDENNQSMGNAFWNGQAMFYGDGDNAFSSPLARSLDVGGHEISHGVVQHTANLIYDSEAGALNESFADIFGVMIDRDNWQLGEDVVNPQFFTSGALRDMSNPHNGGNSLNDRGWQPAHYDERYTGSQDNGGVHINSGIPNFAFYKTAVALTKEKAEQIFYKALTSYLTRTSNFIDARSATIQAARDLYGDTEAEAVALAWTQVGVGSGGAGGGGGGGSNNESQDLAVNPGNAYIAVTFTGSELPAIYNFNLDAIANPLSEHTVQNKPSITDDGSLITFIDEDNNVRIVEIDWAAGQVVQDVSVSSGGGYRNVAISKDAKLIAFSTLDWDNKIYVYDFPEFAESKIFELKNPISSGGFLDNVAYSDALEFDYSGEYIMYDAYTEVSSSSSDLSYWDIGFIKVWEKDNNNFEPSERISKLFSGLEENESVGNPTFSKTNTGIIAFDYRQEGFFSDEYAVIAANFANSSLATVVENNKFGYPNFAIDDDYIMFHTSSGGEDHISYQNLQSDRLNPQGQVQYWAQGGQWPLNFATGTRNLYVGNKDLVALESLSIEPNPANDVVQIQWSEDEAKISQLEIFDATGRLMKSIHLDPIATGNIELEIEELKPGMYEVILSSFNSVHSVRFIKQ